MTHVRKSVPGHLLAILALVMVSAVAIAQHEFAAPRSVDVGGQPGWVAAADFDHDGDPDLAVVVDGVVHVLLGDGTGEVASPIVLVPESAPTQCVVADFDLDGNPDLAVANHDSESVTVFLGDGLGAFGAPIHSPVGDSPKGIVTGDFDEDGVPDIATRNDGGLSMLRGDGAGAFVEIFSMTTPGGAPSLVGAALDADDHLDLAFLVASSLHLLWGNGAGGFSEGPILDAGAWQWWIATGDFDEDGNPDLASSGGWISLFRGDGVGGFGSAETTAVLEPYCVVPADFDEDGHLDLLVTSIETFAGFSDHLRVLEGDGTGAFESTTEHIIGDDAYSMTVVDLDRDGHLDAIVANRFDGDLTILLGAGPHGLEASDRYSLPEPQRGLVTGDFDQDGLLDLVTGGVSFPDETVALFLGRRKGGFQGPIETTVEQHPWSIASADFDGDGYPDLAFTGRFTSSVTILQGGPGGAFGGGQDIEIGSWAECVATGCFDADPYPDLAVEHAAGVAILLNDGSGGFGPPVTYPSGALSRCIVVADFDEDGSQDLALANDGGYFPSPAGTTVTVRFGDGSGGFPTSAEFPVGVRPTWLAAADLNEDGHVDLAVANKDSDFVSLLFGDGNGGFGSPSTLATDPDPATLAAADFTGDGHLDLAVGIWGIEESSDFNGDLSNRVSLFRGDGTGSFGDRRDFVSDESPSAMRAEDFDFDGDPDLAVVHGNSVTLSILRNSFTEFLECRKGTVNRGAGPAADVLFVNGSPGIGDDRIVLMVAGDPLEVSMGLPPSMNDQAKFALYFYLGEPTVSATELAPFGLGVTCRTTPLNSGPGYPAGLRWKKIANNIGKFALLGEPNLPSEPAPSVVVDIPSFDHPDLSIFVQGIIADKAARNGKAAVTNGVILRSQ